MPKKQKQDITANNLEETNLASDKNEEPCYMAFPLYANNFLTLLSGKWHSNIQPKGSRVTYERRLQDRLHIADLSKLRRRFN